MGLNWKKPYNIKHAFLINNLGEGDKLKKALTVVILFALILSSFCLLYSTQNVKAQSNGAAILSYSSYIAPANSVLAESQGDLIVVGEVQNTGTTTLGAIYVSGYAYDSSGQILAQSESKVFGLNLAAGAKTPFYMDFPPESSPTYDLSWVSNVTSLTVNVHSVLQPTTSLNTDVAVPSDNLHSAIDAGNYTLTGSALNAGSDPVSDVVLFASFYNSTGGVIAIGYMDLGTSIQPAGSVAFTITPVDDTAAISSHIVSYAVSALGVPTTSTATPLPTPTTAPTTLPTSTATPSTQPTQPPASLQSNLLIYAAIIVVGLVIAVALVLFILKGRKNKDLPLSPPPA
jgi:hypothetical protein